MSTKKLAVTEAVNPETGEPNLEGALRYVMAKLNEEKDIQRNVLFHTLPGAMQERLKGYGIPDRYLADFLLCMQNIGLVYKFGGGRTVRWDVADLNFFNEFVTCDRVKSALSRLSKRHDEHEKLRRLEKKVEKSNESAQQVGSDKDVRMEMNEHLAQVIATTEHQQSELAEKDAEISQLKKQLADQGTNLAEQVTKELMSRYHKSQDVP